MRSLKQSTILLVTLMAVVGIVTAAEPMPINCDRKAESFR